MPCSSRPCIGLAPGANGSPCRLPSGVLPVFLPYTTFDVIVSTDCVCSAFRYVGYFLSLFMNVVTTQEASWSTRLSLLPNLRKLAFGLIISNESGLITHDTHLRITDRRETVGHDRQARHAKRHGPQRSIVVKRHLDAARRHTCRACSE